MNVSSFVRVTAGLLLTQFLFAATANAGLLELVQFNGRGNWSLDGVAGADAGTLEALVPAGAQIEHAFLYVQHTVQNAFPLPFSHIKFSNSVETRMLTAAAGVQLGPQTPPGGSPDLYAYRYDVKDMITDEFNAVGGGSMSFMVDEESPNNQVNGEVLAIIYSDPSEAVRTIAFLDGTTDVMGDTTVVTYNAPLPDVTNPSFEALLSLGIGHSFQPDASNPQYSMVDVNGERLTSSAGGQNDGGAFQGGLITVGGIGDSTDNPIPGFDGGDDELYDLSKPPAGGGDPFVMMGDMATVIETSNPSQDDLLFFVGINVTAEGRVGNQPVPEPGSLCIWGLSLLGGCAWYRRRQKKRRANRQLPRVPLTPTPPIASGVFLFERGNWSP